MRCDAVETVPLAAAPELVGGPLLIPREQHERAVQYLLRAQPGHGGRHFRGRPLRRLADKDVLEQDIGTVQAAARLRPYLGYPVRRLGLGALRRRLA
jgi:hypothetical protein